MSSTGETTAVRTAAGSSQARRTSSGGTASRPAPRAGRRVKLMVSRVDPFSVMKVGFLVSVALGIALVVMTAVMWVLLMGELSWGNVAAGLALAWVRYVREDVPEVVAVTGEHFVGSDGDVDEEVAGRGSVRSCLALAGLSLPGPARPLARQVLGAAGVVDDPVAAFGRGQRRGGPRGGGCPAGAGALHPARAGGGRLADRPRLLGAQQEGARRGGRPRRRRSGRSPRCRRPAAASTPPQPGCPGSGPAGWPPSRCPGPGRPPRCC